MTASDSVRHALPTTCSRCRKGNELHGLHAARAARPIGSITMPSVPDRSLPCRCGIRAVRARCERTNDRLRWGHGLPMRGDNHLNICRYGSPLDGIRSIAFLANGLACSSVCRLSFGSDIHSRMIFRRASCSGFMFKSYGSNLGRRCRCLKLIVPVAYGPAFRRLGFIKLLTCRIYSAPIASSLSLISGFSCKTMFNKELWTSRVPLYSIKPNLRNLFMKKLTRDRVVPIISASIS